MKIARHIRKLAGYIPGEQPTSRKVVKLNTNENPYPPSPNCAKALAKFDLEDLRRYPDPDCKQLRDALAKLYCTTPEHIFVGNGSDEVLSVAARTFVEDDEIIASLDPSYSLYKTLAAIRNVRWHGTKLGTCPKKDLSAYGKKVSLFLWTNPNAPTGTYCEPAEIAAFAKTFKGVVIVDEAYGDFAHGNCLKLATGKGNRNLIVMRTFSKSYSLAGLRVGFCIGPKNLIAAMYKVKDSYNVDAIAQCVALAAVNDQTWMLANVAKIIAERNRLTTVLTQRGWKILPSQTNFIFARPAVRPAVEIFSRLRERGIFVRYFKGPKTGSYLRVTIGTKAQNDKFIKAINELDRLPSDK